MALKEKRVDAALFPLCLLERLEDSGLIKRGSLKPIGVLNSDKSNECKRTTELFPGWMVGYSAFADTDMTRRFAAVIFSFSPDESFMWGFNVDLTPVIGAMERLHYGPFSYLDDTTIIGFLKKREELLIAIAVFLLFVGIHILRTTYIVRVKTRQLDKALRRQIRLEEENKVARKRIERIERVGLLNQMSSMIAHELKQPLASITNYLGGLQIWNEKRNADNKEKEFTKLILDSIGSETQRVADIVERVRGYAKNTQAQFSKVDLSQIVHKAIDNYKRNDPNAIEIGFFTNQSYEIFGDALELEILCLNLIRNAGQASIAAGKVTCADVNVREEENLIILSVSDYSGLITSESFARILSSGESIKQEGLGVGLNLVRSIVDRHAGTLKFYRNSFGGLTVEIGFKKITTK